MRYRLELKLTDADVGKRVVIRWRPGPPDSPQMTDVLGILEQADADAFAVRTREGDLIVIPATALSPGKSCHRRPPATATPAPGIPDPQSGPSLLVTWRATVIRQTGNLRRAGLATMSAGR